MNSRHLSNSMWGEALSLLEQADRLHRQCFRPAAAQAPARESPVDEPIRSQSTWRCRCRR